MASAATEYSANTSKSSRLAGIFRRAPLVMMGAIFTMIGLRNLVYTVRSAAEAGISFTSQSGITIARIGFGAFPLALAVLALGSLIYKRWRLAGLYMVLIVDSLATAVRILSFWLDHSTASAPLLIPEFVLLCLSIIAIRLERSVTQLRPPGP
ncbi:MAG TPA: hypothetical protein VKW06_05410 [Candidatus Angelobacter sp.]|nr:hypothetical protein [Candidatus Angelobacter sp.]